MMSLNLGQLSRAMNDAGKIVTPLLTPWLIRHGNDEFPDWVADRIRDILTTPPRDRSKSFSASSSGGCLRAQELEYLGIQQAVTDTQLQSIFNDGKWRHLRWQATLLAAGIVTEVEYPLPWPAMHSMGSVDAVGVVWNKHPRIEWRGKEFGFELKGVSTFQFPKLAKAGPTIKHRRQVHRYFLSGGFDLFSILYEDKTTQATEEWVIEPDDELLAGSRRELEILNNAVKTRTLHPMLTDCVRRQGADWNGCQFGGRKGAPCPQVLRWPGT